MTWLSWENNITRLFIKSFYLQVTRLLTGLIAIAKNNYKYYKYWVWGGAQSQAFYQGTYCVTPSPSPGFYSNNLQKKAKVWHIMIGKAFGYDQLWCNATYRNTQQGTSLILEMQ